jgi:hypothetical protein
MEESARHFLEERCQHDAHDVRQERGPLLVMLSAPRGFLF